MKTNSSARVAVGLALTWDGARWPTRLLPPAARRFLRSTSPGPAVAKGISNLLVRGEIEELRICWVPRLKGGDPALCEPFAVSGGKRLPFHAVRNRRMGDIMAVTYRRVSSR